TMGGGTFNYDNTTSSSAKSQNMGALTFGAGDSTVQATRTATQHVTLTFSSLVARTVGVTGNFVVSGCTNGTNNSILLAGVKSGARPGATTIRGGTAIRAVSNAQFVISTEAANDILSISTNIQANGTNALTKSDAATLMPSGSNTYTGGTYMPTDALGLNGNN